MNIILDSRKVLNAIYDLLEDDSYTLTVKIWMDEMAEKLSMSKKTS